MDRNTIDRIPKSIYIWKNNKERNISVGDNVPKNFKFESCERQKWAKKKNHFTIVATPILKGM